MTRIDSGRDGAVTFDTRTNVTKPGSEPAREAAGNSLSDSYRASAGRHIAWFDYAKGICIILVVMMHSTLGVGEAFAAKGFAREGFMHWIVAYAKPFRMPDFFMLAGLFLSYAIGRGWLHYLDKKVIHFAYFYVIWTVIQATIKTTATSGLDAGALASTLADAIANPYPTLWFIYMLPLFFVATKLLLPLPAWALLGGAAVLHILPIHTGWNAIDDFAAHYYIFFLGGYLLAPHILAAADWAAASTVKALVLLRHLRPMSMAAWAARVVFRKHGCDVPSHRCQRIWDVALRPQWGCLWV